MPDIHLPQLEEEEHQDIKRKHSPHWLKLVLEVALISMGVFLGLAGEQWRESRHTRELAEDALRRFRTEIDMNRKKVTAVRDYHVNMQKAAEDYFKAPPGHRVFNFKLHGLEPATFDRTAWDLALATQSLSYVDNRVAFDLARVYSLQERYTELWHGMINALYQHPPLEDPAPFYGAMDVWLGDVVYEEPELLKQYGALLPELDRALGEKGKFVQGGSR